MEKKPTDAQLVRTYISGKDKAFEKLYKRYEKPLFSFIFKFVRNRQSAEDIFQQTWLKVINGLSKYEEKGRFSSWLFGIANNCCIDHARSKIRSRLNDSVSSDGMDKLRGEDLNPEGTILKQEQIAILEKTVAQLPPEQRQVVLLRMYGELPFKEIASILNSSLNTVLGRMHYAVQNLRKMVKQEYGEGSRDVLS